MSLDCANGVGGLPAKVLVPQLAPLGLQLSLINTPEDSCPTDRQTADPAQLAQPATGVPQLPVPTSADTTARGRLNHLCGSDFVQIERQWPQRLTAEHARCALCASLDGDADRIVFYFSSSSASFSKPSTDVLEGEQSQLWQAGERELVLLDGDYIAALVATHAVEVVNSLPLQEAVSVGALLEASRSWVGFYLP